MAAGYDKEAREPLEVCNTSVLPFEVGGASDEQRSLTPGEKPVECWRWLLLPICGSLVIFSVPSMTFSLYKTDLRDALMLDRSQVQKIVSAGLVGGMVFGFFPGMLYDRFGYAFTLVYGGILSVCGALSWHLLLRNVECSGGSCSPTWQQLALAMMVMCHGTRTMYLTGICGAMNTFPQRLASSVSSTLAVIVSCGYIILPAVWKGYHKVEDALPTTNVSTFYLFLASIYVSVTLLGLSVARYMPRQTSTANALSLAERAQQLSDPHAITLFCLIVFCLAFVYTFMTSAVGSTGEHANLDPSETLGRMGMAGMLGRLTHGFCADFLSAKTAAKQAGPYVMYLLATACTLVGFILLYMEFAAGRGKFDSCCERDAEGKIVCICTYISATSWSTACYLISFGFGGYFAMFPATVRITFGASEIGFWLGVLFGIAGVLQYVYGQLGASAHWGASYWLYCIGGNLLVLCRYLFMISETWGA